ncbi:hypothetical protein AVEN_34045-1 [Araneus ventricosus]|uniref:Uncharacterized protein n=1 Tax=Araneus ventricosus TaxID=182803 RepID=A0A4Y2W0Z7_ARAVE|nr:hypothetical protein AVEN_34045-1 [Araneus ventricosus]
MTSLLSEQAASFYGEAHQDLGGPVVRPRLRNQRVPNLKSDSPYARPGPRSYGEYVLVHFKSDFVGQTSSREEFLREEFQLKCRPRHPTKI